MKIFIVPFLEKELVWTRYTAKVEATNEEDALSKLKTICSEDSPHKVLDCELQDVFQYIHSEKEYDLCDFSVNDVLEVDNRMCCELDFSTLDLMGLSKVEVCKFAEEKFMQGGLKLDIAEVELKPIKIEDSIITCSAIPIDFKHIA